MKKIEDLLQEREKLRKQKLFDRADLIRKEIEKKGYRVLDTPQGVKIGKIKIEKKKTLGGLTVVFGSGEISSVGRRIHEYVFQRMELPVRVSIIDTPAGFQPNVQFVTEKIKNFFLHHLRNYKPLVRIVKAPTREGPLGTNRENICRELTDTDYIFTGPGSPTFALRMFKNSRLYNCLKEKVNNTVLAFASAAAIAFGKFVLPVYEIYKAGSSLHWEKGLSFFSDFGLPVSIVPHWNNQEGGKNLDTSCCFMGKDRFTRLISLLPADETIIGIDEQTALIIDLKKRKFLVLGRGGITIIKDRRMKLKIPAGYSSDWFSIPI